MPADRTALEAEALETKERYQQLLKAAERAQQAVAKAEANNCLGKLRSARSNLRQAQALLSAEHSALQALFRQLGYIPKGSTIPRSNRDRGRSTPPAASS
ncbi:transcriptional repressor TraM [Devosia sp. Naph2]